MRVESIKEGIMYTVYSVKINGRTLESRNLKELLARAVNAKRNPDRRKVVPAPLYKQISTAGSPVSYGEPGIAVVH